MRRKTLLKSSVTKKLLEVQVQYYLQPIAKNFSRRQKEMTRRMISQRCSGFIMQSPKGWNLLQKPSGFKLPQKGTVLSNKPNMHLLVVVAWRSRWSSGTGFINYPSSTSHSKNFVIFCNKTLGGSSIAELLATFCDNLLKNAWNEKSNDDSTIKSTIDTVGFLFSYVHCHWPMLWC